MEKRLLMIFNQKVRKSDRIGVEVLLCSRCVSGAYIYY
jgi:hypothetical protein